MINKPTKEKSSSFKNVLLKKIVFKSLNIKNETKNKKIKLPILFGQDKLFESFCIKFI